MTPVVASNRSGVSAAIALVLALAWPAGAGAGEGKGQVRMPLDTFRELEELARRPLDREPSPPVDATVSRADLELRVPEQAGRPAEVKASVTVHVLSGAWVVARLLPAGTSVRSATLDGEPVALATRDGYLIWSTRQKGTHRLDLVYFAPVQEAGAGRAVHLPVPAASAINLRARIPGVGLAVSAIPATGIEVTESGGATEIEAAVPRTSGLQLTWRLPGRQAATITSAAYEGKLGKNVVSWHSGLSVEMASHDPIWLPVLDNSVALATATVDGKPAVVEERDGRLTIRLLGAGRHEIGLDFETPVCRDSGPTATTLWLPRPPIATFRLTLPGKKQVSVSPPSGLEARQRKGQTTAVMHLPPTDSATFTWSEALPEAVTEKLRASAEVYHAVQALDGVLQVQAIVALEVTRGNTSTLTALLPPEVVMSRVQGDGVSDWRTAASEKGQLLTVHVDRKISGRYRYQVFYEHLLAPGAAEKDAVEIPLLLHRQVHRQRGMVALLTGTELEMSPQAAEQMNKIGENQLPAWVRKLLARRVAHTYKYVKPHPRLEVSLAPPERKRGRFNSVVDTLFSVGDGVMKASASIGLSIKSGSLMDLDLSLPAEVNLLGVTAPSLRDHEVIPKDDESSTLRLMFTQEMEGSIRIEVGDELVLGQGEQRVVVPAIHVPGADVERGRLAIEALTAVEVKTTETGRLQPLDVQELPRQLTLRTSNPILLAYKYVHAEPPFSLALDVRSHSEMGVQVAAIDHAHYQSLYTRHGLALTRALYRIRNRRKQFVKVALPPGSRLWSAQLSGQPVKPARGQGESEVLIPLPSSTASFTVELVYASSTPVMEFSGWLEGRLPTPDIIETRATWDVYLPDDLEYGRLSADMRLVDREEGHVTPELVSAGEAGEPSGGAMKAGPPGEVSGGALPLRIEVPRQGVRLRLEKLFANRGDMRTGFSIHYSSGKSRALGGLVLMLATLLLAGALLSRALIDRPPGSGARLLISAAAVAAGALSVWLLGTDLLWVGAVLLVTGAALAAYWLLRRRSGLQTACGMDG